MTIMTNNMHPPPQCWEELSERQRIFERLKNKNEMRRHVEFTAPCNNVLKKGTCKNPNCTFAHYKVQLRDPPCLFDSGALGCTRINCNKFHASKETQEEYRKRIGFIMPNLPDKPPTPPAHKPMVLTALEEMGRLRLEEDDSEDDVLVINIGFQKFQKVKVKAKY